MSGLITSEQLLYMSEDDERYELRRGRLIRRSFAPTIVGLVTSTLMLQTHRYVEDHGLPLIGVGGAGYILERDPDTVRATSLSFVRRDRLAAGRVPDEYFPGPPDLAIDVLSPFDNAVYYLTKVSDYLNVGTSLLWLIDPDGRAAIVFRQGRSSDVIESEGVLDGEDVLPGFRLPLADAFDQLTRWDKGRNDGREAG